MYQIGWRRVGRIQHPAKIVNCRTDLTTQISRSDDSKVCIQSNLPGCEDQFTTPHSLAVIQLWFGYPVTRRIDVRAG